METDVLGYSRTMFGTDPATASGPADPTIPTVDLNATELFGLGACRPNPAGLRVADLPLNPITIWQTTGPGSPPQKIDDPLILDDALFRLGEVYFGPPPSDAITPAPTGTAPSWPAGRYVVEIDAASASGGSLWIALDFSSIVSTTGSKPVY